MRLAPFQKEWLEEVLADGVDAAAMSVPRGNGKSTFLAGVATWAVFDEDDGGAPQVPIVATTMSQAVRSVYGVALEMIRANDDLGDRALIYSAIGAQKTVVPSTGGEMFPISNDVDGLQGLDPSVAVCDELGFMPIESWDSLLLAGGKRPRSLVVGIGTPGLDSANALWHLRRRVVEGAEIPGFHFTEYAADEGCDVHDEEQWTKANPALAARFMNIKALRTAVELSPEGHFRIFRLGQWVEGTDCWLGPDGRRIWDGLGSSWSFVPGARTWVGVDVGMYHDSTAVVAVQARPDGRWHAKPRIWMPVAGEPTDVTDVMHHLRQLDKEYDLVHVAYDARLFDLPAKTLEDEGLPMVEIKQSVEQMTPAVGGLYELIQRGEISHDGDPAFAAQVLNAIPRFNEQGFTLAKRKSRGKIDAAVALALATYLARRPPEMESAFSVW